MKVKINNKDYIVPELTIEHYVKMEEQGFSVLEVMNKGQVLLSAMMFTCAITGLDRAEAEALLTQHIYGGGNVLEIFDAFKDAVGTSDFFRKMLGATDQAETTTKKKSSNKKAETE